MGLHAGVLSGLLRHKPAQSKMGPISHCNRTAHGFRERDSKSVSGESRARSFPAAALERKASPASRLAAKHSFFPGLNGYGRREAERVLQQASQVMFRGANLQTLLIELRGAIASRFGVASWNERRAGDPGYGAVEQRALSRVDASPSKVFGVSDAEKDELGGGGVFVAAWGESEVIEDVSSGVVEAHGCVDGNVGDVAGAAAVGFRKEKGMVVAASRLADFVFAAKDSEFAAQ